MLSGIVLPINTSVGTGEEEINSEMLLAIYRRRSYGQTMCARVLVTRMQKGFSPSPPE